MPVGDTNVFSDIDAGIWAALQETSSSQGTNLSDWRSEQDGGPGKDFDTGEVPPVDRWRVTDFPALLVNSGGFGEAGSPLTSSEVLVQYPVEIVGAIRPTRDHQATMKKLRAYGSLVTKLVWLHARTCFSVAVIQDSLLAGLEYVQIAESEEATAVAFVLGLDITLNLNIA